MNKNIIDRLEKIEKAINNPKKSCSESFNNAIISQLKQIANHYGFTSQANMLTEETAEYTVALNKLRELLGPNKIDQIIHEKIDRQLRRIQNENAYCEDRINAQMEVINNGK